MPKPSALPKLLQLTVINDCWEPTIHQEGLVHYKAPSIGNFKPVDLRSKNGFKEFHLFFGLVNLKHAGFTANPW